MARARRTRGFVVPMPPLTDAAWALRARLRELRRRRGMSRRRLTLLVAVSGKLVQRFEHGDAVLTEAELAAICAALGVDPHAFFGDVPPLLRCW